MARKVEEELLGYQFSVHQIEAPVTDERGNVVHNGTGEPTTEPRWILQLEEMTPLVWHVIRLGLTQQAKDELVRQLTGGIAIATQLPSDWIEL